MHFLITNRTVAHRVEDPMHWMKLSWKHSAKNTCMNYRISEGYVTYSYLSDVIDYWMCSDVVKRDRETVKEQPGILI